MECKPSVHGDIQRYFQGTYVKLKEFGDKLFYLESVNKEQVVLVDENKDNFVILLEEADPYHLEYVLPHRAVFPFRDSVSLLQRIPAKQYHRGCCGENTRIVDIFTNTTYEIHFRSLTAYIAKPNYVDVQSALFDKASKKLVGVAITDRISFGRLSQAFYVDNRVVGTFNRDKSQVEMVHAFFKPELAALFQKANLPMEFLDASGKRI